MNYLQTRITELKTTAPIFSVTVSTNGLRFVKNDVVADIDVKCPVDNLINKWKEQFLQNDLTMAINSDSIYDRAFNDALNKLRGMVSSTKKSTNRRPYQTTLYKWIDSQRIYRNTGPVVDDLIKIYNYAETPGSTSADVIGLLELTRKKYVHK